MKAAFAPCVAAVLSSGASLAMTAPAHAELPAGEKAPVFTTRAAFAKGPVVLYFYPKAFTHGCTLEANAFVEAMPQFKVAVASAQDVGSSGPRNPCRALQSLRRR